jgi:hypothetical protein
MQRESRRRAPEDSAALAEPGIVNRELGGLAKATGWGIYLGKNGGDFALAQGG